METLKQLLAFPLYSQNLQVGGIKACGAPVSACVQKRKEAEGQEAEAPRERRWTFEDRVAH